MFSPDFERQSHYIISMKLTMQIKLLPDETQADNLLNTIERFNAACNYVSQIAHAQGTASHVRLHKAAYYSIRDTFGLTAQMAVRAIGKVSEAYKRDRKTLHHFREHGAMALDDRMLSYKGVDRASIATLVGRVLVPFVVGSYGNQRLEHRKGQADLVYRDGIFFLHQTVDLPDPPTIETDDVLGVDLGIVNLATDSDGEQHIGDRVERCRQHYERRRSGLQRVGTKGSRRQLKHVAGRERRLKRDVNHCISKRLVEKAKGTRRGIALEELTHLRARITVQKPQRSRQGKWAFGELRLFLTYKSRLHGVPLRVVDPRYSSQECSSCGHTEKANRVSQSSFVCRRCGFVAQADYNAARVIRARALVNAPMVSATGTTG